MSLSATKKKRYFKIPLPKFRLRRRNYSAFKYEGNTSNANKTRDNNASARDFFKMPIKFES